MDGNAATSSPQSGGAQGELHLFDRLFEQCAELCKLFPDYQFKFSAALGIVIGWLLTAKEAQNYIMIHGAIARPGAVILALTLVGFHSAWVLIHFQRARACHAELQMVAERVGVAAPSLLESVRLHRFLPVSYIAVNALTCAAIVVIVFNL